MADGRYFTESDTRKLKAALAKLQSQFVNLTRRLGQDRKPRDIFMPPPKRVRFRNDNQGTVPAYAVMRVTDVTKVRGKVVVKIDQPDTSFNRLYLVNGKQQIGSGSLGWGTWLWESDKVLYESGTPAFGESWGPKASQWSLAKWRYGFTIDGENDSTALTTHAKQMWVNHFWGQTQGAIDKDGTGTVEVLDGNDAIITSTTVGSVKNKFADVADDKKVSVEWLAGSWYLKAAGCAA